LRRAIPRHVWLANRARNALGRRTFIVAISIGTFVTAAASIAIGALARGETSEVAPAPRPDTLSLLAAEATGRLKIVEADSTIVAVRASADSMRMAPAVAPIDQMIRDSLLGRVHVLEDLMARADQAPLPPSYRALAMTPELRLDLRTQPLLDTLTQVEQDREQLASAGGVDPVFVALTTRVNELGRAIQAIALERRNAMVEELAALAPAAAPAQLPDTARVIATRDSARNALREIEAELAARREAARSLDREEARARAQAQAVAPTHALLGAAFIFSAVIGFAVAFVGEIRRPRVSDAAELERHLGVRVVSTAPTMIHSPDRGRREADRSAPPHFNPNAEGYQLAYLALATEHPSLLMATVTGDDPAIAAVVGCNLAAIAADEARNTLVIDLDPSGAAAAALRARSAPGITDIIERDTPWPAATTVARAGRDRVVDLVPYGSKDIQVDSARLSALLTRDANRMARYYDAVILIARPSDLVAGLATALPSRELLYCVQPGVTPLQQLREQLDAAREAGAVVRGLVIWDADRPELGSPAVLARPRAVRPAPRRAEPSAAT
jgi:Mrp family chromosome partitioning ATPase